MDASWDIYLYKYTQFQRLWGGRCGFCEQHASSALSGFTARSALSCIGGVAYAMCKKMKWKHPSVLSQCSLS